MNYTYFNYKEQLIRIKRLYLAWIISGLFLLNLQYVSNNDTYTNNSATITQMSLITSAQMIENTDIVEDDITTTMVHMEKIGAIAEPIVTKTVEYKSIIIEEDVVTPVYEVTEDERELLARLVELEAGNQTLEERAKVVQVVFNRVNDGRFGEGIEGVIFAEDQFEPAPNIPYTTPSELSYQAVDAIIWGDIDLSDFECLYFYGDGQLNHFR